MLTTILTMCNTLTPVIFAGIFNMIFCKSQLCSTLNIPMDNGKNFIDGKRLFGDNKTWKGLFGYLTITIMTTVLWGLLSKYTNLHNYNYFYIVYNNTMLYNILIGFLLGSAYALFELPNSFIKRRINIEPGKTKKGVTKILFLLFDQIDSIIGCGLIVWMFYDIGIKIYLGIIFIGAITHIIVNLLLYTLKLRKNMF